MLMKFRIRRGPAIGFEELSEGGTVETVCQELTLCFCFEKSVNSFRLLTLAKSEH
jgi:hypothetical protein